MSNRIMHRSQRKWKIKSWKILKPSFMDSIGYSSFILEKSHYVFVKSAIFSIYITTIFVLFVNLQKRFKYIYWCLIKVHLVKKVVVEVSLIEYSKVLFVGLSEVQIDNTVKREVKNPTQTSGVYDLFIPCLRHLITIHKRLVSNENWLSDLIKSPLHVQQCVR